MYPLELFKQRLPVNYADPPHHRYFVSASLPDQATTTQLRLASFKLLRKSNLKGRALYNPIQLQSSKPNL